METLPSMELSRSEFSSISDLGCGAHFHHLWVGPRPNQRFPRASPYVRFGATACKASPFSPPYAIAAKAQ
jgi:hypothetical protein